MKSILISIHPEWVEKIASGEKTIEVRKSAPKEVPFKAYIYCTKGKSQSRCGKVIGEFICNRVDEYRFHEGLTEFNSMGLPSRIYGSYLIFTDEYKSMCLSYDEVKNYGKGKTLKGWHISDLKIYDKPKELSEFRKPLDRVWGSYCNDYCDRGCISFGSTDYSCNDYWNWEKGLTRPPQSWCYVESLRE